MLRNELPETLNYADKYLTHPHSSKIEVVKTGKGSYDLVKFKNSPNTFYKKRRPTDIQGFHMKRLPLMNPYPAVLNQRRNYLHEKRPATYAPTLSKIKERNETGEEEEEEEESRWAKLFHRGCLARNHSDSELPTYVSRQPRRRRRSSNMGQRAGRALSRFFTLAWLEDI